MANVADLARDGPYGGQGGSAYDGTHNEQRVRHIDAWSTQYQNYDVLGAIQFGFEDGTSSGRIGGRDPNLPYYPKSFDFADDENIDRMTVFAGNGEGFCNGFTFHTTHGRTWNVGGTEGLPSEVPDLGRQGEWAGATGRDGQHGADAVIDSMILYFKQ
ncbi:hypothetical protein ASPACDRAFT_125023 [Aspergillus aculeatus ATCC 16872]|uniref:Jacalin-type lectin domain-containing protein n=1 Tax=Aspergillus aculeatus (strain ATCC 16872 / CBS 172.66 / WB 5094) TaxID=690307 RepID=A0A1L9WJS9_ASPA1|nr:uncharacterized protein ASPACDRAFT_125023 [Aspergillus aculeatus ATCC 16872]OJJ96421.1 hypothetical protein ASPACDRAFT_125023 [Aspergillus aculeatus ATCC 16872]